MNINCVICSDLFVSADSIFTTPCGHIFHHACLIQWLERSKTCPQCRNKCTERNIFRIFFNNNTNLDSTQNSANLVDKVDNLTLLVREKDQALKAAKDELLKHEETLQAKEKKIERLDISVSRNVQIIATMRHEMDILASHRANIKAIEAENAELKAKLELMTSIESVLTASQAEVDEILKHNLNARDLAVMVGTLRRELNSNEVRKNDLRKQLQMIKNDFRRSQDERRDLQDKLSSLESENHRLLSRVRHLEKKDIASSDSEVIDSSIIESPDNAKRPRLALILSNELNTPSPLTQAEFKNRVAKVQTSDSPYLRVKASSIALSSVLQKPLEMKDSHQPKRSFAKSKSNEGFSKLSIFKKPRMDLIGSIPSLKSENVVYNGIGGTSKVLQSDLKESTSPGPSWPFNKPINVLKRKNLSASALRK